jgi:hypothetical protein
MRYIYVVFNHSASLSSKRIEMENMYQNLFMGCTENSEVEGGMDGEEAKETKCCKFSSHELYLTQT